jgi:3-hydroxybutyrate dehydrogenase
VVFIGINLAFAELLLENGCNVVIADLALRPEAQAVVNKYSSRSGPARAVFQKTDVTDWAQLEELFLVAGKEFTEIDIVCPGAGVYEEVRSHSQPPSYESRAKFLLFLALEQLLAAARHTRKP